MTPPSDRLVEIIDRTEALLFSFDGPICRLFTDSSAPRVTAHVRQLIADQGVEVPDDLRDQDDPVELFRAVAAHAPQIADSVGTALAEAEVQRAQIAETTLGLFDVVRECQASGRTLAIVSNTSSAAIGTYLARRDRTRHFAAVIGRDERPELSKPSPVPVVRALRSLDVGPGAAVLVGDSPADVEAAHAAGIACIGFADEPGSAERLLAAGADAIVTDLTDFAKVLSATRKPRTRLRWIKWDDDRLIVVPASVLTRWGGMSAHAGGGPEWRSRGDYGRACQVDGVGVLEVGDGQALVLGDEPVSMTFLPDQRLFVGWGGGSEDDAIRLIPEAVAAADWEDAGTWTTSGPAWMFNCAFAGEEMEQDAHLAVELAAGTYLIRTAYVETGKREDLTLVHLVEQPPAAPKTSVPTCG